MNKMVLLYSGGVSPGGRAYAGSKIKRPRDFGEFHVSRGMIEE